LQGQTSLLKSANSTVSRIDSYLPSRLHTKDMVSFTQHVCAVRKHPAVCRQGKFGQAAHFTLRCGRQLKNGDYQTPVIALACNFEQSHAWLTHHNAATLVHEFGHALHSLLSRTQYQHLSGVLRFAMCLKLAAQAHSSLLRVSNWLHDALPHFVLLIWHC